MARTIAIRPPAVEPAPCPRTRRWLLPCLIVVLLRVPFCSYGSFDTFGRSAPRLLTNVACWQWKWGELGGKAQIIDSVKDEGQKSWRGSRETLRGQEVIHLEEPEDKRTRSPFIGLWLEHMDHADLVWQHLRIEQSQNLKVKTMYRYHRTASVPHLDPDESRGPFFTVYLGFHRTVVSDCKMDWVREFRWGCARCSEPFLKVKVEFEWRCLLGWPLRQILRHIRFSSPWTW